MNKLALISVLLLGVSSAALAADEGKPAGDHPHKGGMFKKMDADGDGVVTKAEADAFHEKKFGEIDANKDGKITKEEQDAHRKQMREKRQKRKEEKSDD